MLTLLQLGNVLLPKQQPGGHNGGAKPVVDSTALTDEESVIEAIRASEFRTCEYCHRTSAPCYFAPSLLFCFTLSFLPSPPLLSSFHPHSSLVAVESVLWSSLAACLHNHTAPSHSHWYVPYSPRGFCQLCRQKLYRAIYIFRFGVRFPRFPGDVQRMVRLFARLVGWSRFYAMCARAV